jgi:branched-subunit amino acid ABC-type transport system permease component
VSSLLPFIFTGLTSGSVYAMSAMGLTLTYRTTGIFNFAQGAIGTAAAYVFYDLTSVGHMAWPLAAIIVILVFGIIGGFFLERVANVLARVDTALVIVATVGMMVAIQALIVIRYSNTSITFPPFLPTGLHQIAGATISTDSLIIIGVALVSVIVVTVFLRVAWLGKSTRAVVDDPHLLALTGASPTRVRRISWVIGTMFAAISGILAAEAVGTLDPSLLTLLLVNAFAASALGAFRSITWTYVGGLAVGIAASLSTKWITGTGFLAGIPAAIPILILFVTLLVVPRRHLLTRTAVRVRPKPRARTKRPRVEAGLAVLAVVVFVIAPQVLGDARLPALTGTVDDAILLLSLVLLVRMSGQVSLCQYALAAVGAACFYKLADHAGLPWLVDVLLSGLVAAPVGALAAITAVRLSGMFLALATFAFGILLENLFFTSTIMFTQQPSQISPRPSFATGDYAYYYVVLAILVLSALLVLVIDRSRLGRLLRGMGQSQTTLATHGLNVTVTKMLVFSLSGFLAGISGALMGPITGSISSLPFDSLNSLTLVALLVLAGRGTIRPAIVGGCALSLIPSYITSATVVNYLPVLYGVSALTIAALSTRAGGEIRWTGVLGRRKQPPLSGPQIDGIGAEVG